MQASSAERGNSDAKNDAHGAQFRSDNYQNKGHGNNHGHSRGFYRGHGRGGNPPSGGGHQVIFCKTQVEEMSHNEIESIYPNKGDKSINSEGKYKDGVCYFLMSRLPTAPGPVNGKEVVAM